MEKTNRQITSLSMKANHFWYDAQNKYVKKGFNKYEIFLISKTIEALKDSLVKNKRLRKMYK